jgi:hypothetical protein
LKLRKTEHHSEHTLFAKKFICGFCHFLASPLCRLFLAFDWHLLSSMHLFRLLSAHLPGVPPIGDSRHDYQDQANIDAKPALGIAPLGYIFESTLPAASLMVSIPSPTLTVTPALVLASSTSTSPTPSPIPTLTVTPAVPTLNVTPAPVEAPQADSVASSTDVVDAVPITSATAESIAAPDAPSSFTLLMKSPAPPAVKTSDQTTLTQ